MWKKNYDTLEYRSLFHSDIFQEHNDLIIFKPFFPLKYWYFRESDIAEDVWEQWDFKEDNVKCESIRSPLVSRLPLKSLHIDAVSMEPRGQNVGNISDKQLPSSSITHPNRSNALAFGTCELHPRTSKFLLAGKRKRCSINRAWRATLAVFVSRGCFVPRTSSLCEMSIRSAHVPWNVSALLLVSNWLTRR